MTFSHKRITVKYENDRGFTPCLLEIENGFAVFQKMGAVAGVAGGLVGLVAEMHAKKTNEVVRIPLNQITSVETNMTFVARNVTVRAAGFPAYTFGCSSKKEMEQIAALLRGNGSNNPEPPRAAPAEPVRPAVKVPEPKLRSVTLQVTAGARAGAAFRLQEGQTAILGRDPSRCNLPLGEYNTISGRHCCLELSKTGLTVTDLGSTNGTWVNGARLLPNQPTAVPDGSELWLAGRKCSLQVKFD